MLNWFRLEIVVALGGAVGVITQVIKTLPPDWTSNYPKTIAFVVSAIVVGGIGFYEKADISTIVTVTLGVAVASYGLYDVVKSILLKLKESK